MRIPAILLIVLGVTIFPARAAENRVYEVGVDGIACPFCAYGIEKELSAVDGVESLAVDLKKGLVVVRMKEGATLDAATASQAAKRAGFSMRSFAPATGK